MSEKNNVALAEYLKALRTRENLNQLELAEKLKDHIKISQSTISAYESGIKSPNANNLKLLKQALENVFGSEGMDTLRKTDENSSKDSYSKTLISDDLSARELLMQAEDFLKKYNYQYSLWFVGNEKLPVALNSEFQKLWERMLKQGVDYNIIIFADKLNENKDGYRDELLIFRDLATAIEEILKNINDEIINSDAKIRIYLVKIAEEPSYKIKKIISQLEKYKFFESRILSIGDLKKSQINIMQAWQSFAAISIYEPKNLILNPAANLKTNNVSYLPNDENPTKDNFFWFDKKTSDKFSQTINEFKEDLKVKQDDKNV